jgi:hypothetical protein
LIIFLSNRFKSRSSTLESHRLYCIDAKGIHCVKRPIESQQSLLHRELIQLYLCIRNCFPNLYLLSVFKPFLGASLYHLESIELILKKPGWRNFNDHPENPVVFIIKPDLQCGHQMVFVNLNLLAAFANRAIEVQPALLKVITNYTSQPTEASITVQTILNVRCSEVAGKVLQTCQFV